MEPVTKDRGLVESNLLTSQKLRSCGTHSFFATKIQVLWNPFTKKFRLSKIRLMKNATFRQEFRICGTRLPENASLVVSIPIFQPKLRAKFRSYGTRLRKNSIRWNPFTEKFKFCETRLPQITIFREKFRFCGTCLPPNSGLVESIPIFHQ